MKRLLAPILLLTLLFPALVIAETMDGLVKRDGIYYKKFSTVPFTGKVTGLSQGTFKDGERDSAWVNYFDNGQLWSKGTYKDRKKDGPWIMYHGTGQLWRKGTYKDVKSHGPWVRYWENGQLWDKGTYKNDKMVGPWVSYWKDGTVMKEYTGTFKNGVKVD
jgi:antitoxin component YwqK of YwqJK toxin-antitoxin module